MRHRGRKWLFFTLRWGVAIVGIWWVLANLTLRDRILVLDELNRPLELNLTRPAEEDAREFHVYDPASGQGRIVPRAQTVNRPEKDHQWLDINEQGERHQVLLLGLDLSDNLRRVERLLVSDAAAGPGRWITQGQVIGAFELKLPRPRVDVGLLSILKLADSPEEWTLLAAAIFVFPLTYLITSFRWNRLLHALDIDLPQARTFVLNMVGAFYNTFMPGSTGGDVLKAYYASKQTHHRARAVYSVFIDRVIGLLGLVLLGGVMATYQYITTDNAPSEATIRAIRQVALGSLFIFTAVFLGLIVLGFGNVRRALGIDYVLARLPMQKHVQHAIGVARIYRARPGLVLWALLITLPVHITVVCSAMFAGKALGLPIPAAYYFIAVPVIVLAGAVPISPQGAGVMEFFAIILTRQYGTTVGQAFALTMSIRLVQILWNLVGGIFVLRGGYHAPTEKEQEELEAEEGREDLIDETPAAPSTAPSA